MAGDGKISYEGRSIDLKAVRPLVARELQDNPELPVIVTTVEGTRTAAMVRVMDEAMLAGARKLSTNRK